MKHNLCKTALTLIVIAWAALAMTTPMGAQGLPWAWGDNQFGQLGDGTTTPRFTPVPVSSLTGVAVVAVGSTQSLALKSDGTVWAWGFNGYGQLGDGSFDINTHPIPVQVVGLSGIVAVAGGWHHSLAVKSDGSVWAWGGNTYGQLGNGSSDSNPHPLPALVSGLSGVVAVAAGSFFSLALKSDGSVWAWGYNTYGELGDGKTIDQYTPVQVSGLSGITAVAAGGYHSLALTSDGTAWAWGENANGQLGDGSSETYSTTPVPVVGLPGVVAVSGGGFHSLALKSDGTVWAWGYNLYGQLGEGSFDNNVHSFPVQVAGLSEVVAVAAGLQNSLAVKSDGSVWAWGLNDEGQLGDGTEIDKYTPVQVLGQDGVGFLTGVGAVAAGSYHSLALPSGTITTTLAVSKAKGHPGKKVKLKAILRRTDTNAGIQGETVQFLVDGNLAGWAWTNAKGKAKFKYTIPQGTTVGNHALTAVFSGDVTFQPSSGSNTLLVK